MSLRRKKATKTEKEKVEQRREEVLAKGRKFKYPLQWTRHHIVVNTIIIGVLVCALMVVGSWAALYKLGRTDTFLFNITKVFPLSVASVDGKDVRFSDYLIFYRSSMTSAERQSGGQINDHLESARNQYKRAAINEAEGYVLALQLADQLGITVSDEEISKEFERHLSIGGGENTEEGFIKVINDNFGLTKTEYERILYLSLIRAKVETTIDTKARDTVDQIEKILSETNNDYTKVAETLGDSIEFEDTGGLVDSKNIDGGRAITALKLEPGQSSGKFVSMNGDGYYFVKLNDKTDTKVNFVSIRVPFKEFNNRFKALRDEGKINEFIDIPNSENQTTEN